ncbi:methionyl-tRNA formyltransferase [Ahrensia sp. R2A130]|uniref:methionyl-tRNA formyltransferase n=1 Tax=Ahrensia sp. R2A130 TaxID=744979 RepID=UPI0001E0D815|nr:methionyl-tRNA formyltransferase [Ahrensia sp. R2A130]EFL89766.1 methionyl-tRNA formyltransferase [Ahrensia sp. R2A130]
MRIIFMGTPEFSVPTLQALHDAGHQIVACYSQPPKPAGRRGRELTKQPVHLAAEALGIPVHTPVSLKGEDEQTIFAAHNADVAVVVAYGLLLPKPVLDAPKHGCLNGHGSLLPRWRGAAPIQRAIMAGDAESGIQVMAMEEGLDTGPVAATARVPIGPRTTVGDLHDALSQECASLMVQALADLKTGTLTFTPQLEDGVIYAKKIDKAEARIDWTKNGAEVAQHINGLSPFPGAWFEIEQGGKPMRVKALLAVETSGSGQTGEVLNNDSDFIISCGGSTAVQIERVQKAGGKPVNADEFLRGVDLPIGTTLT